MGKLIRKTAAYTLIAVCACLVFVLSVLTLFAPMTLSDAAFRMNAGKLSADYARLAVANGKDDVASLAKLVERSSLAGRYRNVTEYGAALTENGAFAKYAAYRDERDAEYAVQGAYADYIAGLIAAAYYRLGEKDEALAYAAAAEADGYRQYGAWAYLVFLAAGEKDREFGAKLESALIEAFGDTEAGDAYAEGMAILNELLK